MSAGARVRGKGSSQLLNVYTTNLSIGTFTLSLTKPHHLTTPRFGGHVKILLSFHFFSRGKPNNTILICLIFYRFDVGVDLWTKKWNVPD